VIAHVAFVDCTTEQAEDAARRIAERVWPVLRGTPGFRSSVFLVDRAREEVVTVTLWESDEARAAADAAGPPDRRRVFEEIGVRRREARIFDVLGVEGYS
jgi:heme-degrading monooxygenase HmoA